MDGSFGKIKAARTTYYPVSAKPAWEPSESGHRLACAILAVAAASLTMTVTLFMMVS